MPSTSHEPQREGAPQAWVPLSTPRAAPASQLGLNEVPRSQLMAAAVARGHLQA